ncbi:hypothetical protein B4135_2314 [Caldibacillus debilis]|uniref:Uncharacterized protein n=1 Tax=Caldibacillus debilis TaxID=301148 RepID=A0A150M2P7_9BACI|nr:hypothetical protein B4135_2314 [Caldibacillus debilis]
MELPFGSAINVRKKTHRAKKELNRPLNVSFHLPSFALFFLSISLSWEKPFPGHLQKTDA